MAEKVALPFEAEDMLFSQKRDVETHPEPVSGQQPKICLILPLQINTQRANSLSFE